MADPSADRKGRSRGPRPAAAEAGSRPRLSTSELFAGGSEIVIEHNNEDYRLRITSNGKLILTK